VADGSSEVLVTLAAAAIGAVIGFLFFTDRGRKLRRNLEPTLEDLAREIQQFRGTVNKAVGVADEGWKLVNETLGEPRRYHTPRQSSPF
jgi:hypothetical protein